MFLPIVRRPLSQYVKSTSLASSKVPKTLTKFSKRTFISSPQDILTVLTASIQTVHQITGIPWVLLIPLTSVTLRSLWTLPLAINQRKRSQKQASLRPIINAMGPVFRLKLAQRAQTSKAKELQNADHVLDKEGVPKGMIQGKAASLTYEQILLLSAKERRERQKKLFKENNCQLYKNFVLPVFQIPLWIAMSATIRDLTGWNDISSTPMDPSLTYEGMLWFTDLTVADPTSILPVILGTIALTNVEWNFRTFGIQNFGVKRSKRVTAFDSVMNLSRFGVVFLMAIATQAPTGLVLYWISSNGFSLVQNILLDYWVPLKYGAIERFGSKRAIEGSIPLFQRKE